MNTRLTQLSRDLSHPLTKTIVSQIITLMEITIPCLIVHKTGQYLYLRWSLTNPITTVSTDLPTYLSLVSLLTRITWPIIPHFLTAGWPTTLKHTPRLSRPILSPPTCRPWAATIGQMAGEVTRSPTRTNIITTTITNSTQHMTLSIKLPCLETTPTRIPSTDRR